MVDFKDITGQVFGRLTVIKRVENTKRGHAQWLCKCECGKEVILPGIRLRCGHTKSCGCLYRPNLTGQRFGRLTVLELHSVSMGKGEKRLWLCECECGKEIVLPTGSLRDGNTRSCGCLNEERRERLKMASGEAALNALLGSYKKHCNDVGRVFNLTKEEFRSLTKGNCYYCGHEPNQISFKKRLNGKYIYNGIDRRDNDKGYTAENCVPCCKTCNRAKRTMTESEFVAWINRVYNHLRRKMPLDKTLHQIRGNPGSENLLRNGS